MLVAASTPAIAAKGGSGGRPTARSADLAVLLDGLLEPAPGVGSTFSLATHIANRGPEDAASVAATVTIPAGLLVTRVTRGMCSIGTTVTCSLGDIASGASAHVTLEVRGESEGDFTVPVETTSVTTDPNLGDNRRQWGVRVANGPDLSASVTAAPPALVAGGPVTFEATIRNNSTTRTASPLSVRWSIYSESQRYVSVAPVGCSGCSVATLAPGATTVARFTALVSRTTGIGSTDPVAVRGVAWAQSTALDPVPSNDVGEAAVPVYLAG